MAGLVVDGIGGLWKSQLVVEVVEVLAEREVEKIVVMMLVACLRSLLRVVSLLCGNDRS
jgi:uracil phosphoribosyltransferase